MFYFPKELLFNKPNHSDTKAPFLDLSLSISNDIITTKMNDYVYNFYFETVKFPFWMTMSSRYIQKYTVDSRYLEGTPLYTSRYPYIDISDLQN